MKTFIMTQNCSVDSRKVLIQKLKNNIANIFLNICEQQNLAPGQKNIYLILIYSLLTDNEIVNLDKLFVCLRMNLDLYLQGTI